MHDPDIRSHLHAAFAADGIAYVEEVTVRNNRIDMLAMLDGVLTGIEIKSSCDTLGRLPAQKRAYRSRFRHLIIVTEASHLAGVRAGLPPWWGIWLATAENSDVTLERSAAPARAAGDSGKAQPALLAALLFVAELKAALGLDPDCETRKAALIAQLCEQPIEQLEKLVLAGLIERRRRRAEGA